MDDDRDPTKRAMPRPKPYSTPRVGSAMLERNSLGRRLLFSLVFLLALAGVVVFASAYYFGAPAFLADLLFG